jgi:hypothetical protein
MERALDSWAKRFPDEDERIRVLYKEFDYLSQERFVQSAHQNPVGPRHYEKTLRNLRDMLAELGENV